MIKSARAGLCRDRRGATAIEFAIVAPVFLLMIFGIISMGLISWRYMMLASAGDGAAKYLRQQRVGRLPITEPGLREAVCTAIAGLGQSCTAAQLKIGLYDASDPTVVPTIPTIIGNTSNGTYGADAYIIIIASEWTIALPTTSMLLPTVGSRSQVQAAAYAILRERPMD